MADHGLLTPGAHRAAAGLDDAAVVAAMLQVERAWVAALAQIHVATPADAEAVAEATASLRPDLADLAAAAEAAGNPVAPLLAELRAAVDDRSVAQLVHRGLTSQDVLDTALVLLARDALVRVREDLLATAHALVELATQYRHAVLVGRTLTQHAVPTTFGLKAASWLTGVLDAVDAVESAGRALPVQCGGAAGTLALAEEISGDSIAAARAFAQNLNLVWPGVPWHTNRAPITRIGNALVTACDAAGVMAADITLLSRPEIGEVREGVVAGRGGSSTMPHKRNPVLSILIRSAALQAPLLGAQLHLAAAQAVDERPDGAWHSEWPVLRRLLSLAVTATSQAAELAAGLEVQTGVMAKRAAEVSDDVLAERPAGLAHDSDPATYLGANDRLIDAAIARFAGGGFI